MKVSAWWTAILHRVDHKKFPRSPDKLLEKPARTPKEMLAKARSFIAEIKQTVKR